MKQICRFPVLPNEPVPDTGPPTRFLNSLSRMLHVVVLVLFLTDAANAQKVPALGYIYPPAVSPGSATEVRAGGFDLTSDMQWMLHDDVITLDTNGIPGPMIDPPGPYWTGPRAAGPSLPIFTKSFYEMALERLTPEGVLVTQAGPAALGMTQVHGPIVHTLEAAAGQAFPYRANVISFGCEWGFALVSKGMAPDSLSPEEVDRRIAKRVKGTLRFLDGASWPGLFSAPKWLRAALAAETTVLTEDTQVFLG